SFSILWGKLLASMSFVFLLLLLSVPIFSLVFLFGGIELDQVVAAFIVTAVGALTLGVIGIACSTAFRRTLAATVAAYGASFILLAGSLLYGLLFPTSIDPNATAAPAPPAVSYLSPLLPLITIGTSQPVTWYGIGSGFSSGGGGGMMCSGTPGGGQQCVPLRSEEHTSELQSRFDLVCRLLLEKKKPSPPITIIVSISSPLAFST